MLLTKSSVEKFNLENAVAPIASTFSIDSSEFFDVPGKQHYRLLASIASNLSGAVIIDIGSHMGSSALALASNPANIVHSFDIIQKIQPHSIPNLHFHIADLWDTAVREQWKEIILRSKVILLDIDPHAGEYEYEFYQWLKWSNYEGIMICDDIWYFKEMRDKFWYKIPTDEKIDISWIGHWSGTGVVSFVQQEYEFETCLGVRAFNRVGGQKLPAGVSSPSPPVLENQNETVKVSPTTVRNSPRTGGGMPPPTIVTAYFDLTRMPDASKSIKDRPKDHYLNSSTTTLSLDQPMVVYCEKDYLDELMSKRPQHLHSITKFIVVDFEDLPLTQYRQKIIDNRIKNPYRQDDRNTASYYLLCMARYCLLQKTIEENPFESTHFAWLNICIERMGYKNAQMLNDIFDGPLRDKFSTIYIDYIDKGLIENVPEYFQYGRCSLCSGFFTGRADYMMTICTKIIDKFMLYLEMGYGHADEQLYSPVYFENQDMFETYYGDYFQMITNYRGLYENARMPLDLVIPKSAQAKDWITCRNASKWVFDSHKNRRIVLSGEEMNKCLYYYRESSKELGMMDEY